MVSEIQYGGRVTDDGDKAVLAAMTSAWIGEHMLSTGAHFRPDTLMEELPGNFSYK